MLIPLLVPLAVQFLKSPLGLELLGASARKWVTPALAVGLGIAGGLGFGDEALSATEALKGAGLGITGIGLFSTVKNVAQAIGGTK